MNFINLLNNWLKNILTPKNTEEIRPGIFLQKRGEGDSIYYKVINPIVYNGKYRLRHQFSWRNLIWIAIIVYLAWSYSKDIGTCKAITEQVKNNPQAFCKIITNSSFTDIPGAVQPQLGTSNISALWK